MRRSSLHAQLLRWVLLPLMLVAALGAWLAYGSAEAKATAEIDRRLLGSARVIAEQLNYAEGVAQIEIPPAALELLRTDARDRVYYRVATADGALLRGYGDLPLPPQALAPEQSFGFDTQFRAEPVRVLAFAQPVLDGPVRGAALIEVAQTLHARSSLTFELWTQSAGQQLLLIALAGVMISIGVRRELSALNRLGARVRGRPPGTLEPLGYDDVPAEMRPVIESLNDYVHRLHEQLAAQGRFIADASHQLRTPLTVLSTQLDYALRGADAAGREEALRALGGTLRHGIRVVNQMLSFSRAEAGLGDVLERSATDLADTVRQVVEEAALTALARGIDLGCELAADGAIVHAAPSLLHELVANLVDNALRYGAQGGVVTVSVQVAPAAVRLLVEDDGPGIPADKRERAFERFYRLHGGESDGCGLGLSIVREIAHASQASVALTDPPSGRGLLVIVEFPRTPEERR